MTSSTGTGYLLAVVHAFPSLPRARRTLVLGLVVVFALLLSSLPAVAASDDELRRQLEQAQDERQSLLGSLQAATERVDNLEARLAGVQDRAARLSDELAELEKRRDAAQEQMVERAVLAYKGQAIDDLMVLASTGSLQSLTRRTHYLSALTRSDRATAETASALASVAHARRAELSEVRQELDGLVTEANSARAELTRQFAEAGAVAENLRTELARREAEAKRLAEIAAAKRAANAADAAVATRRAAAASRSADAARDEVAAAVQSSEPKREGGMVCPQAQPRSFTDTWGAPRSGGRSHQGTDFFGARGGPVYAITDGTIMWTRYGDMAGYWLSLRGDDGHQYWYLHLQDFVAQPGQRVSAGELIAHNGDTGNAQGTSPHIHFEYHPGGGGAVNPYPLLKSLCG